MFRLSSVLRSDRKIRTVAVMADRQVTCGPLDKNFETWVDELRARYGSMRAVAERFGMTESGFFRGVKRGTLSVENLLDLARVTDEPPSKVLRLAGKGQVADLIERLYGPGRDSLKDSELRLLERWQNISDAARRAIEDILDDLQPPAVATSAPARKKKTA